MMGTGFLRQLGRTMVEMLAVIAIMGIISAGVVTMAHNVFSTRNENMVLQRLPIIVEEVQNALSWVGTYNFNDYTASSAMGKVRTSCTNISCYLKNQKVLHDMDDTGNIHLGGSIISFSSVTNTNLFSVKVNKISKPLCVKLFVYNWGDLLYEAKVNGTNKNLPPLSLTSARDACSSCVNQSSCYVDLTFQGSTGQRED